MNSERAAGYEFLIREYQLKVIPHWHSSFVSTSGTAKTVEKQNGFVRTTFSSSYWPGDSFGDHLEFALKYDGTNPGILAALFSAVSANEIALWVEKKPTGKYTRRIWFLFEFITGEQIPLNDLTQGNYVELLEPGEYFVADSGVRAKRQRIINNLLGNREFCPVVRKTKALSLLEEADIYGKCSRLVNSYPAALVKRALGYLYSIETKSSFEIEHLRPSASRAERFIASLEMATTQDFCNKEDLILLQNSIVDKRFRNSEFRMNQNFIGEMISFRNQRIHYVCPKPEDLGSLMEGLQDCHANMLEMAGSLPAIVHAAIVAFGFVYLHPFEDGNGRIHRFLIHNVFFLKNAVPDGLMFPVSAAMLSNLELYDHALENFSRLLLPLLKYKLDDLGEMSVGGDTGNYYRFIDLTVQAEALFEFVKMTVDNELPRELEFLVGYDRARKAIQEVIDMPDRKLDLLLNLCLQNNGRLSAGKRKDHFTFLSNDEIKAIEKIVNKELSWRHSQVE